MPELPIEQLIPLAEFKVFLGVDNVTHDDLRLAPGYLRMANNVDIDSQGMPSRRDGILRQILSGQWHSLWSDEGSLGFGVKDGNLVSILPDWSVSTILSSVGPSRMAYVKIDDRVFFSNASQKGYIRAGVAHGFPETDRPLRKVMVGGDLLEYHGGRLLAAQGPVIYCSIPYTPTEMDSRKCKFQPMGRVGMIKSTGDGLYVGTDQRILWYPGDPFDSREDEVIQAGVKPYSGVTISDLKVQGVELGKCVLFHTTVGAFLGIPGGKVIDLTSEHYAIQDVEDGAALIRSDKGYRQYVYMAQAPAYIAGTAGAGVLPSLTASGRSS